ncbi:MAG TPA: sulfatase-like hydrolase/transferase [Methanocellaceae archaeon]
MTILTILILLTIVPACNAQSAVILVIDSFGSSCVYHDNPVTYTSGVAIPGVHLSTVDEADGHYTLRVPVPETEHGHSVIVTGYSDAIADTLAYYNSTIFDVLRDRGYLCLGIMETGDTDNMLDNLDIAVREKNNSIYKPCFELIQKDKNAPDGIVDMMGSYPTLNATKAGKDPYAAYIRYDNWSLGFAADLVDFMNSKEPDENYVLLANNGGLDEAGHTLGSDGYEAVMAGLDPGVQELIDACSRANVTLLITGDHGMSFKDSSSKGSHASADMATRNESTLVPLLIYSANDEVKGSGLYTQEDLAPTLLALLDCPNTLSMCDGVSLPVKNKPSLYVRSNQPVNVTLTGQKSSGPISVNGIYEVKGLDKGTYFIKSGDYEKTIDLRSDMLVDIPEEGRTSSALPLWSAYAAAGVVSIVGIFAALKFVWRK